MKENTSNILHFLLVMFVSMFMTIQVAATFDEEVETFTGFFFLVILALGLSQPRSQGAFAPIFGFVMGMAFALILLKFIKS